MSCWEILGIAQTSDLTAIKKAYAAKAKEWHPEEHPEEFKRLQQAYQSAVRMSKIRQADFGQTKAHKDARPIQTVAESRHEAARRKTACEAATEKSQETEYTVDPESEDSTRKQSQNLNCEDTKKQSRNLNCEDTKKQSRNLNCEDTEKQSQNPDYEDTEKQFRNPGYEDTSKRLQNCDHEEIQEQSQAFDYEEVEAADLKDRFFQEFFSVAWNPYLMNNLVCWEYLLKRAPYEQLLSDPAFRRNFVLTACHQLMGWRRGTLLLFEKWLKSHPAKDADKIQKKETDLLCWKLRKIGLFGRLIPTQRCVTAQQKKLHEIFLTQVEHSGLDTSLKSEEDVACYLSFYLPYAAGKQSRVKQLYHGSCQGRMMFTTLLLMVPIFIGMVIYVQACVVPQMNKRKAEEAERQRIQQQTEEIRQYSELFQNGEYTESEELQEYYDEIIQKSKAEHEAFLREYYKLYPDRRPGEETTDAE